MVSRCRRYTLPDSITSNQAWSDEVFATCEIQITTAEVNRLFWRKYDFNIEEESGVFVEAIQIKAFYEGCLCHD